MQRETQKLAKLRCAWANENALLEKYHDEEWGVPVHDDKKHFEMIILEGAQAGLSWLTILKKRENYRKVFNAFEPTKAAMLSDTALDKCLENEGIIRNRLKVYSVRKNAIAFLTIQKEFGSFDQYIWQFVDNQSRVNSADSKAIPTESKQSIAISNDLKKRGMVFVGPKIIYAYLQAVGIVNGHTIDCFRYKDCLATKKIG